LRNITGPRLIKKILLVLCNPKIHYHIQKCPPLVSILSQSDGAHTPTSQTPTIHFNIIILSAPEFIQVVLSLRFPHQKPVHNSPLTDTCYMSRPSHFSRFGHPKIAAVNNKNTNKKIIFCIYLYTESLQIIVTIILSTQGHVTFCCSAQQHLTICRSPTNSSHLLSTPRHFQSHCLQHQLTVTFTSTSSCTSFTAASHFTAISLFSWYRNVNQPARSFFVPKGDVTVLP